MPDTWFAGTDKDIEVLSLSEMCREYRHARLALDAAEDAAKVARERVTELGVKLHNALVMAGMDKVSVDGVTFRPEVKVHASLDSAFDVELAYAVLRQHGAGGLIKETIHPATFGAYVREQMDAEPTGDVPDWMRDFVKVYRERRIATRRG